MKALPLLLLLGGCASSAPLYVLEYWDEAAQKGVGLALEDTEGKVAAWMSTSYRPPRPPNEMGAVMPAGGIVGPDGELRWLYVHGSRKEGDDLIPQAEVDRLFVLFRKEGRPYAGPLKAGYRGINDPASPLRSSSPPIEAPK